MSQSLYKDTLKFLSTHSKIPIQGHHQKRLSMLCLMICSTIKEKDCSLEGISRPVEMAEKQSESSIKQAKRWLSSKWTDWASFFAPYIENLLHKIATQGELILVIDGSETGSGCVTLMLSVIWKGYALPIVWFTKEGKKGHFSEDVHMKLITIAQNLITDLKCRVVLLGDGEFDGAKLRKQCEMLGWEFVLRTSLDRKIDCGGEIAQMKDLGPQSNSEIAFVQNACQGHHAILWQDKNFESPIPLLTNMELGQMACAYYRKRFTIETLFKQMKSAGFQIHKSKLKGAYQVANLIIIVAFAFIFTFCLGLLLKKATKTTLQLFVRADRVDKMSPITIAQKCIRQNLSIALAFFSDFASKWDVFCSSSQ